MVFPYTPKGSDLKNHCDAEHIHWNAPLFLKYGLWRNSKSISAIIRIAKVQLFLRVPLNKAVYALVLLFIHVLYNSHGNSALKLSMHNATVRELSRKEL